LQSKRELADFVEQKRALVRCFDETDALPIRAGERSFFVTEELALEQIRRNRGAAERHKRLILPAALTMYVLCNYFFSRARFAQNEHRRVRCCKATRDRHELSHRGIGHDDSIGRRLARERRLSRVLHRDEHAHGADANAIAAGERERSRGHELIVDVRAVATAKVLDEKPRSVAPNFCVVTRCFCIVDGNVGIVRTTEHERALDLDEPRRSRVGHDEKSARDVRLRRARLVVELRFDVAIAHERLSLITVPTPYTSR